MDGGKLRTRTIAYAGLIAALYAILTMVLAPISFGPIQLRIANLLKPLVLFNPAFAIGFGIGDFVANSLSPFGAWDFLAMPVVDILAGFLAWKLRKIPWLAISLQSIIISVGVWTFPLHFGGGLPLTLEIFLPILVAQIIVIFCGWFLLWQPRNLWIRHMIGG